MVAFTSDTHYFHRNILLPTYADRPFSSVEEMNEALIERFNEVVKPGELVIHSGDFAFQVGNKREEIKEIIRRLDPDRIIVVKGNHDSKPKLLDLGFKYVYDEMYLTVDGIRLWVNHFPLYLHDDRVELQRPKASMPWDIAIHGHRHSRPEETLSRKWDKLAIDVGVDGEGDFKPYTWKRIKEIYERN